MPHPAEILFSRHHPLTASFDMRFQSSSSNELTVFVQAPKKFAGTEDGLVHTGFSTLLLDTVMGSCAIGMLEKMQPIATIKLTCNHLRSPHVGEELSCNAICEAVRDQVSYVRGEILAGPEQERIAHAIATFMIGTRAKPLAET